MKFFSGHNSKPVLRDILRSDLLEFLPGKNLRGGDDPAHVLRAAVPRLPAEGTHWPAFHQGLRSRKHQPGHQGQTLELLDIVPLVKRRSVITTIGEIWKLSE